MMRIGFVVVGLSFALVGCNRGSADCPGGAQRHGKKPPAGQVEGVASAVGVKQGPWRECSPNGNPSSAGSYVDGKMEGKWQTFYEDGSRKSEGLYKAGFKDGIWTIYYSKGDGGTKNRVEEHHAGSQEIKWTVFRSDGAKWAEGMEMGSRPHGPYTEYHDNGKVAVKGNYAAGAKAGEWAYFDKEGKPSSTPTGTFQQQ